MEVATDLTETPNRFRQRLSISGRTKAGSPFEESETEEVVQVGSVDDSGGSLIVEGTSDRLGDLSLGPAADRRNVQARNATICKQIKMFQLQPASDGDLVQPNQRPAVNVHRGGSKSVLLPPVLPILLHRVRAGRKGRPHHPYEVTKGGEVGAEILETLSKGSQAMLGAVESSKLAKTIIKTVVPAQDFEGWVLQRSLEIPDPPNPGAVSQGTSSTNARTARITSSQLSGVSP